jgi:hypothetical protein
MLCNRPVSIAIRTARHSPHLRIAALTDDAAPLPTRALPLQPRLPQLKSVTVAGVHPADGPLLAPLTLLKTAQTSQQPAAPGPAAWPRRAPI